MSEARKPSANLGIVARLILGAIFGLMATVSFVAAAIWIVVPYVMFAAVPITIGGYMIQDWRTVGHAELLAGKRATTAWRRCDFHWVRYGGGARMGTGQRRFEVESAYMFQLDGQMYRCYANDICPCLEKQIAIRDNISSFRCDEHVDVLYDPADPRVCRRVEFVGLRSDREEREGPLGMALCAGGVGFVAYRIYSWRKRRGGRGTAP